MNDILSIHIDSYQNIWLGSSYGISNLKELENRKFQKLNYNENDGLLNNTIHGILEGDNGKLWLSSNTGIVLFDPKKTFRNFNQKSGLKVIEFSDNAYFKNEEDSTYFLEVLMALFGLNKKIGRAISLYRLFILQNCVFRMKRQILTII